MTRTNVIDLNKRRDEKRLTTEQREKLRRQEKAKRNVLKAAEKLGW